jgi:hypothetical protein
MRNTLVTQESPKTLTKRSSNNSSIRLDIKINHNMITNAESNCTATNKIDQIRSKILGFNTRYISPFNIELETIYVDHTATNRAYRSIEDMIDYAKKFAANPHTEFSHFGSIILSI